MIRQRKNGLVVGITDIYICVCVCLEPKSDAVASESQMINQKAIHTHVHTHTRTRIHKYIHAYRFALEVDVVESKWRWTTGEDRLRRTIGLSLCAVQWGRAERKFAYIKNFLLLVVQSGKSFSFRFLFTGINSVWSLDRIITATENDQTKQINTEQNFFQYRCCKQVWIFILHKHKIDETKCKMWTYNVKWGRYSIRKWNFWVCSENRHGRV